MKKALTDFIMYSSINLTWFAFNFLLITMPAFSMWMSSPELELKGVTKSYMPIVLTLNISHVIAFAVKVFIYSRVPP